MTIPTHPECTHGPMPIGACARCTSAAVLRRRMYQPDDIRYTKDEILAAQATAIDPFNLGPLGYPRRVLWRMAKSVAHGLGPLRRQGDETARRASSFWRCRLRSLLREIAGTL